jgi:hypothetical protein
LSETWNFFWRCLIFFWNVFWGRISSGGALVVPKVLLLMLELFLVTSVGAGTTSGYIWWCWNYCWWCLIPSGAVITAGGAGITSGGS